MSAPPRKPPVLVTGGAGFIGSNLADALAAEGHEVLIYDALTRPGVERNLAWLERRHPGRIETIRADVRDGDRLADAVNRATAVFHMAAQVAVTTSMVDPREDFAINVGGTFNLLEALRMKGDRTPVVFASTNKVYGDLADLTSPAPRTAIPRPRRRSAPMASARRGRSTSTRPTAARRAPPTNMSSTTAAASACPRRCSG
jgi:CDP-paratose 2-epimerase